MPAEARGGLGGDGGSSRNSDLYVRASPLPLPLSLSV